MKPMHDESGNAHYITTKIGEDGQGLLYQTKNEGIILRDATGKDHDRLRYDDVKLLPVSEIKELILPGLYLRKPNVGYLMTVPADFVPLTRIIATDEDTAAFYKKTGGLKRRLSLLVEISRVLHKLHSLPCMYGGMSADRVFVSKDSDNNDARLLYSVKMTGFMPLAEENDTDPYIAGEARRGQGDIQSDAFAFGSLAYDLLTMKDTHSLPDGMGEVVKLLDRAKSAEAANRPKIIELFRAFLSQLDVLLTCQNCKYDFYYTANACPACKSKPPKMLRATIYDQVNQTRINRGFKIFEFSTNAQSFWCRHTDMVLLGDDAKSRIDCMVSLSGDKKLFFVLKNQMEKEISVNNKPLAPGQATAVPLPAKSIRISFDIYSSTRRYIDMVMA